jgi:putative endonuclease
MRAPFFHWFRGLGQAVRGCWQMRPAFFCWPSWLRVPAAAAKDGSSLGRLGEKLAAEALKRSGMQILHHSYRSRLGEVDLIGVVTEGRGPKTIVFVEVKTWSCAREGGPAEAVDGEKQRRLTRLALAFLKTHRIMEARVRFDVVEVVLEPYRIRHFPGAFEATGKYQWYS